MLASDCPDVLVKYLRGMDKPRGDVVDDFVQQHFPSLHEASGVTEATHDTPTVHTAKHKRTPTVQTKRGDVAEGFSSSVTSAATPASAHTAATTLRGTSSPTHGALQSADDTLVPPHVTPTTTSTRTTRYNLRPRNVQYHARHADTVQSRRPGERWHHYRPGRNHV